MLWARIFRLNPLFPFQASHYRHGGLRQTTVMLAFVRAPVVVSLLNCRSKQSGSSTSVSTTPAGVQDLRPANINESTGAKRNFAFWMVFVANLTVDMLSALDLVRRDIAFTSERRNLTRLAISDRRLDCSPNDSRAPPRNRLYLGRKRLHHRFNRYPSSRRRSRLCLRA